MPKSNPAVRDYNMPDGDLIQKADELKALAARDAVELATRNYEDTTALEAARDAFANFPTDAALKGLVTDAAGQKDAARASLETAVGTLRNMAELAHEGRPGLYNAYGFAGFANLSDNDAHRAVKTMVFVANGQVAALSTQGLTNSTLTDLENLNAAFDTAIDGVKAAEATRDTRTQERVTLGNALFKEVSRLSTIGQSVFVATNEAKYNDYVLDPAGNANNQPDPGEEEPSDPPNN